jgi:hypothetical protein
MPTRSGRDVPAEEELACPPAKSLVEVPRGIDRERS